MRVHAWLLAGSAVMVTGCGFEDAKQPTVDQAPLAGRWCRPSDATLDIDGRVLAAFWFVGVDALVVERTLDDVVFERQAWTFAASDGHVVTRTIETPDVLDAAELALVQDNPLDDLQALVATEDWAAALPTDGTTCDVLPSAYGHGYPLGEGWYVAGATSVDGTALPGSEWYGHGGEDAAAPFAPAKSKLIELTYDDAGRMIEEKLDRGATEGGPHNLLRTRAFAVDGTLVEDRIERWSPTPKEDVLRVLAFTAIDPRTLERALVDTFDSTLDVRYIPRPTR